MDWLDPDHQARIIEEEWEPEDIEWIREQLHATLAKARAAKDKLPWGFTESMGVERTFRNRCGWLPPEEAYQLRCAFVAEMARLYDAIDEWPPFATFPPVPPNLADAHSGSRREAHLPANS